MVSLVDLGPLKKTVPIRGLDIEVKGITAHDIFALLQDYPELRYVLAGKKTEGDVVVSLINGIPGSLGSIIAAATGHAGEPEHIGAAQTLTVGEQTLILEAAIELTFPQGVSSFAASLAKLASQAGARGWGAATSSPAQSNDASAQVTQSSEPGSTHQDSSQVGEKSSSENASPETSTSPVPSA